MCLMIKNYIILLTFFFLLGPTKLGLAESPELVRLSTPDIAESFAILQNNLYLLSKERLYVLAENGEKVFVSNAFDITHLGVSDKYIYGFASTQGEVFILQKNGFEKLCSIATQPLEVSSEANYELASIVVIDDQLYILIDKYRPDDPDNPEAQNTLVCFDLIRNTYQETKMPNVASVSLYRPGELLLYQRVLKDGEPSDCLLAYICKSGTIRTVYQSENIIGGAFYDQEGKQIVFSSLGEVLTVAEGQAAATIGYTRCKWSGLEKNIFRAFYTPSEIYTVILPDGDITEERVDESFKMQRVLRIAEGMMDAAYASFCEKYPDVHVIIDIPTVRAGDIQNKIDTDTSYIDIFSISLDQGYKGLREKGYLHPLNSSAAITNTIKQYYPQIQTALKVDGSYVALPYYFSMMHWTLNESLWREVLPDLTPPQTYQDLLALLLEWPDKYEADYPDIYPVEFAGGTRLLLIELTKQYILQSIHKDEAVHFDSPAYRQMIAQVMELNRPDQMTIAEEDEFLGKQKLISFIPWSQFGIFYDGDEKIIPVAPMTISEGDSPAIPVEMRVYFVNPRSPNKDLAIAYLEEVALHLDPVTQAGMMPGWTQTVMKPASEQNINQQMMLIEMKRAELETADEKDRRSLQDEITKLQLSLDRTKSEAYIVTPESLRLYHEMTPYMLIPLQSPYFGEDSDALNVMIELLDQMLAGRITPEQCTYEMERKSQMIYREDNW